MSISFTIYFIILSFSFSRIDFENFPIIIILSFATIFLSKKKPYNIASFGAFIITAINEYRLFLNENPPSYSLLITLLTGIIWATLLWLRHFNSECFLNNLFTGTFSLLISASLIYFLSNYIKPPFPLSLFYFGFAVFIIVLSFPILKNRKFEKSSERLAILFTGATILLSTIVPLELEQKWIAVAWAIEVPFLLFLASKLEVPFLKKISYLLSAIVFFT